MVCGDVNYCRIHKRTMTDEQIKRSNYCKDFDLNPIDALGENEKGYCPRQRKAIPDKPDNTEQMQMEL